MSGAALELRGVSARLGSRTVLSEASFALPAGSMTAVVGPSGAGKSTLLRVVAGLEGLTAGEILIDGAVVATAAGGVEPARRGVGLLFQGLALWPHMTATEHLEFVLKSAGAPQTERGSRASEALAALGLGAFGSRLPGSMSGGERQRLALARAVVARPRLLLLDEPTASLDPATARDARRLVASVAERFGATALLVTHDQEEAMELGERTVVLDCGRVLQVGTPEELYASPADAFVARFVGEGALVPAECDGSGRASTPFGEIAVRGGSTGVRGSALLRPEHVATGADGVAVRVAAVAFRGATYRHRVVRDGIECSVDGVRRFAPGSDLRVVLQGEAAFLKEGTS